MGNFPLSNEFKLSKFDSKRWGVRRCFPHLMAGCVAIVVSKHQSKHLTRTEERKKERKREKCFHLKTKEKTFPLFLFGCGIHAIIDSDFAYGSTFSIVGRHRFVFRCVAVCCLCASHNAKANRMWAFQCSFMACVCVSESNHKFALHRIETKNKWKISIDSETVDAVAQNIFRNSWPLSHRRQFFFFSPPLTFVFDWNFIFVQLRQTFFFLSSFCCRFSRQKFIFCVRFRFHFRCKINSQFKLYSLSSALLLYCPRDRLHFVSTVKMQISKIC